MKKFIALTALLLSTLLSTHIYADRYANDARYYNSPTPQIGYDWGSQVRHPAGTVNAFERELRRQAREDEIIRAMEMRDLINGHRLRSGTRD